MGRGKGKWKKQVSIAAHDQAVSGGEEKIMPLTRRGRPRKLLRKETEEKKETKIVEEEKEEVIANAAEENERKRKRSSESLDSVEEEENGPKTRDTVDDSVKFVGFRQSGRGRKNKPRRAAEVGVECYCY